MTHEDVTTIELTERQRELCGWALRSKIVEPHFTNERMKNECRELANKLSPIPLFEEARRGGEGP